MLHKEGASSGSGFAGRMMPGIKESSFKSAVASKLGIHDKAQPFPLRLKAGGMADDGSHANMEDLDKKPQWKEAERTRVRKAEGGDLPDDHMLHRGNVNKKHGGECEEEKREKHAMGRSVAPQMLDGMKKLQMMRTPKAVNPAMKLGGLMDKECNGGMSRQSKALGGEAKKRLHTFK